MADGRSRHHLPRRRVRSRHRRHPAGPALHRGAPRRPRRHRHHARARGPHRRRHRAVAAPAGADLRDAVHRRHAESQARRVRRPAEDADPRRRRSMPLQGRPVRRRARSAMAHSIPEISALAIRTPLGTVFHTGDWKLDPTPRIGAPADDGAHREARRRGRAGAGDAIPPTPCARAVSPSESRGGALARATSSRRRRARVAVTTFCVERRRASKPSPRRRAPPAASWSSPAAPCTA